MSTYFPVSRDNMSVTGFSMGGHGALMLGFKTDSYRSVSAIAPISHPAANEKYCKNCFSQYFNNWEEEGKEWDSTELLKSGKAKKVPLFVE